MSSSDSACAIILFQQLSLRIGGSTKSIYFRRVSAFALIALVQSSMLFAASPANNITSISTELTGFTSELSDQFHTRVNYSVKSDRRQFYAKSGYSLIKSYSYSGNKVSTTTIDSYNLDSQYRVDGNKTYKFVSATASVRDRSPIHPTYGGKTGYYLVSTGIGKAVSPDLDAELALAAITTYDDGTDHRFQPVASLRWRHALTQDVSLNSRADFIGPLTADPIVDTRTDVTYKFTPNISLRLSYVANNLLTPVRAHSGWDKSFRISLVFSRTTR